MLQRLRWRKIIRDWAIAAVGLAALGLAVYLCFFQGKKPTRHHLAMTAGSTRGQRHHIAEVLQTEARNRGIDLRIEPTRGSEEMLDRVNDNQIPMALLQGGLQQGERPNIRQVAALHVEPLHLLVKDRWFTEVANDLAALKGKVVNLSEEGSGTHTLALEIMRFIGLKPGLEHRTGDFQATTWSYARLLAAPDSEQLPDAVFMVSSLPSPVAKHLVANRHYRLVPLPFAEAFAIEALAKNPKDQLAAGGVEKGYIYDTTIPAFTYSTVEPKVPAEPLHTLGTRLILVAHKDVNAELIGNLVDTIFTTGFVQVGKPALSAQLLHLPPEFPLHLGTEQYLRRNKPLIAADLMAIGEKVARIGAPTVVGLLSIWQWYRQRRLRQRELGFKHYMLQVNQVEHRVLALESAATLDLATLLQLQHNLSYLKKEVLDKFAEGALEGKELMSGFLAVVNDTRNYLTRLILHERDHLKEQAQHEGIKVKEIWARAVEALGPRSSEPATDEPPRAAPPSGRGVMPAPPNVRSQDMPPSLLALWAAAELGAGPFSRD
jgi:TRAP-type uncharacterized transport system substrate-binding protein